MKLLLTTLLFLILNFVVYSQQNFFDASYKVKHTTKIDEFGEAIKNECDRGARLDPLAFILQNNPNSKGQIIIYLGADEPFRFHSEATFRRYKTMMKSYLVRNRDIGEKRLNFVNGGFRPKISIELWTIPENGEVPKLTNSVPKPTIPTDRTSLYSQTYLSAPYEDIEPYEFLLPAIKAEYDKAEKELWTQSGEKKSDSALEAFKLSKEETDNLKFFWADDDFGKIIRNQPNSKGVIIFYLDERRLDLNKVKRFVTEGKLRIAQKSGVDANRIKIVYGGYREGMQADMWIVPRNIAEPKPIPEKRAESENKDV